MIERLPQPEALKAEDWPPLTETTEAAAPSPIAAGGTEIRHPKEAELLLSQGDRIEGEENTQENFINGKIMDQETSIGQAGHVKTREDGIEIEDCSHDFACGGSEHGGNDEPHGKDNLNLSDGTVALYPHERFQYEVSPLEPGARLHHVAADVIFDRCLTYLRKDDGTMYTEGLFMLHPSMTRVRELQRRMSVGGALEGASAWGAEGAEGEEEGRAGGRNQEETGKTSPPVPSSPHEVAALLLQHLQVRPDPLIPSSLYAAWLGCQKVPGESARGGLGCSDGMARQDGVSVHILGREGDAAEASRESAAPSERRPLSPVSPNDALSDPQDEEAGGKWGDRWGDGGKENSWSAFYGADGVDKEVCEVEVAASRGARGAGEDPIPQPAGAPSGSTARGGGASLLRVKSVLRELTEKQWRQLGSLLDLMHALAKAPTGGSDLHAPTVSALGAILGPVLSRPPGSAYLSIRHTRDVPALASLGATVVEHAPELLACRGEGEQLGGGSEAHEAGASVVGAEDRAEREAEERVASPVRAARPWSSATASSPGHRDSRDGRERAPGALSPPCSPPVSILLSHGGPALFVSPLGDTQQSDGLPSSHGSSPLPQQNAREVEHQFLQQAEHIDRQRQQVEAARAVLTERLMPGLSKRLFSERREDRLSQASGLVACFEEDSCPSQHNSICRTQSGRSAQLSSEQQLFGAERSNPPPPASSDTPAPPPPLTVPSVPCSPSLIPHPSSPDLKCLPHAPPVPVTPLSQQPNLDKETGKQALIVESSINGGEHEPRWREDTEGSNVSTQTQTRGWKAIEKNRAVRILQRLALTFVRRQRKRRHMTLKEQKAAPCEADRVIEVAPVLGVSEASRTVQALGPCCEARSSSPLAHPTSSVNQTCNAFAPEGDAWEAMRYWKPAIHTKTSNLEERKQVIPPLKHLLSKAPSIPSSEFQALLREKKRVKARLKNFNAAFLENHGRLPSMHDKEPMRRLYREYNLLKLQIAKALEKYQGNRQEESRGKGVGVTSGRPRDGAQPETRVGESNEEASITYWGIITPGKDSKRSGLPPPSPRRGGDLPIVYSPTRGQPSTHDNLIGGEMTSMNRLCNLSQRSDSNLSEASDVRTLRREKKRLHVVLRKFESSFREQYGRRILTAKDIAPVEKQYERYIHIKSTLATLASMEKSEEISEQKETLKSRNILNTSRE